MGWSATPSAPGPSAARARRLGAPAGAAVTVMVALLRGVNVGGKTTLPMAEAGTGGRGPRLRGRGHLHPERHLVFRTSDSATAVEKALAKAIAELGGVRPAVMVRTLAQLRKVVDGNPFIRRGEDAALPRGVRRQGRPRARSGFDLDAYAPEEAIAVGKELYLFLPGGVGRSKLALDLAKDKSAVGTMRNWRTVTKLLEMATAV